MRITRALLILILVLAGTGVARAHQTSVKYLTLAVDGSRVDVTFKVSPGDVTEPLGLPADARPTPAEAAASPAVAPYVQRWLAVASGDGSCAATTPASRVDDDGRFVVISWFASCAGTADELHLDFGGFFAIDHKHVAIVRLSSRGVEPTDSIVRAGDSPVTMRLGQRPAFTAWIGAGIDHIWEGIDHIAFVLALLLVVMLKRGADGWTLHPPLKSLRRTATVITAFTVAHSISLIVASLGWVSLPGRVVESMIALSICYTAIEDVVHPDAWWRFVLTFVFGLVHGLGFASVLSEMLPPSDVIVPLLGFNVGVEIGQLAIVAVALPVFGSIAYLAGPRAYRRIALPIFAGLILVLGTLFLVERVGGLKITGM